MADPKIPDIGKYRIIELVGEGAMGVVYRAVDSVLNRTVAIKVMNESIARQDDLRQRFLHEAQAAASLQHPNVVTIYDLGEVDGHLYIAMEYVPGVDLERLMKLGAPMSLQEKLDIVIDVLTGLTFAHKRGIVHRDIKPANIQVAEDGRAKVMDFGVAHLASSNLTTTGTSLGTPGYMAPEQIVEGRTTSATDIFAVGVVLYELLTGSKPFEGATLQNLFFKIISEKAPNASERTDGLPPSLDHIIAKALAKEPSDRYATALDMANDLSGVRGMLSGPSYPSSVSLSATVEHAIAQAKKSRERTRHRSIAGAAAVAAILVAGVTWSMLARSRTPAAEVTPISTTASGASATPTLPATAGSGVATVVPPASAPPAAAPRADTSRADTPRVAPPVAAPRVAAPRVAAERAPAPTPARRQERPVTVSERPTTVAERPSRAATPTRAAETTRTPVVSTTPPPVVSTAPPATQPSVQQQIPAPRAPVVPAGTPLPTPEGPPAPPTAADLAPTVEAYARAIESRDVAAIRRVYPGLTAEQQRGFEQFFQAARRLNVTFRITNVESSGSSADARLSGSYQYENASGRVERQPVSFVATLRRDGPSWRLISVH